MKKTTHPPLKRSPFPHKGRRMSYISPEIEIISLNNADIITKSPTETTQVENTDGMWDLNHTA